MTTNRNRPIRRAHGPEQRGWKARLKLADMGGGSVSDSDTEIFHIFGATRDCDCRWRILVDWSSQGRKGTATIDDNGRPFRTVGIKNLPGYEVADWPSGTYRWKRRPPAPNPIPLR
ncbi:hypothetical protein [Streptosporangium sp. NPDC001681]|uniref:hypothetical protein n=1 Tax=Streptosporangium sp. NPDC001681 TaxID=3154395 RepID=UPI003327A421